MDVPPHPHTGLQTVSWLFTGQIEHRDSLGSYALVRPGELNLMTGGRGIAHSEVSTPETTRCTAPSSGSPCRMHTATPPGTSSPTPTPDTRDGATIAVFLGSLAGQSSPVETFTPLLGAEVSLEPGAALGLDLDPTYEHGVLVDIGSLSVEGTPVARGALAYLPTERTSLTLTNSATTPRAASSSAGRLRGGHPHVVELRSANARGDRGRA